MTAPLPESDSIGNVGRVCAAATDGRRAARALAAWCERFTLSEPEFQVLWRLHESASGGSDQTMLAKNLAYSPAQVSATVERLRTKGWIVQQLADGDRRRNLWLLSTTGHDTLATMLRAAHELGWECPHFTDRTAAAAPRREAA